MDCGCGERVAGGALRFASCFFSSWKLTETAGVRAARGVVDGRSLVCERDRAALRCGDCDADFRLDCLDCFCVEPRVCMKQNERRMLGHTGAARSASG